MEEMKNTTATEDTTGAETTTYTQEDFNKKLQSETDKRVSQAIATAKAKWESEIAGKIDIQLKDYEKKASMTPEQLKALDLEEKFKMLEAKEKEYQAMTRKMEISQKLQEKKLSTMLVDFVYADDMDVVEQKIATLEQLVLGMVNEEVEKRISSNKPKSSVQTAGLDKEKFQKMGVVERQELFRTNPELYRQLSN